MEKSAGWLDWSPAFPYSANRDWIAARGDANLLEVRRMLRFVCSRCFALPRFDIELLVARQKVTSAFSRRRIIVCRLSRTKSQKRPPLRRSNRQPQYTLRLLPWRWRVRLQPPGDALVVSPDLRPPRHIPVSSRPRRASFEFSPRSRSPRRSGRRRRSARAGASPQATAPLVLAP
jgi:hypothetical protein